MPAKMQDDAMALEGGRWDDVRVFLALQRQGSLGAAGKRLGLDTSTMSRRLTAFEEALGVRLFERTRQGLLPTRAAQRLLPTAEAMEAAHARLTRDASAVEATAEGVVRLSAAPGMADRFVAPLLPALRRRHPRITIELDAAAMARDLGRWEADLALRSVAPEGAELVTTRIGTGHWVAAGAPALVKRVGRLGAWTEVPWIAWDRDISHIEPARWMARWVPRAEIALRTSHFAAQLAAAAAGLAVGLFPTPYLRACGLAALQYKRPLAASAAAFPQASLWLVGHRALRSVPRVAVVWDFFARELRRTMDGE